MMRWWSRTMMDIAENWNQHQLLKQVSNQTYFLGLWILTLLVSTFTCYPHLRWRYEYAPVSTAIKWSVREYEKPSSIPLVSHFRISGCYRWLRVWLLWLQDFGEVLFASSAREECGKAATPHHACSMWYPLWWSHRDLGDLWPDVQEVLHTCHTYPLQLWNSEPTDVFLLSLEDEGRQYWGHLRYLEAMCIDL